MTPEQSSAAPSIPIFSAHAEAKAAEALNVLIFAHGGGDEPVREDQFLTLRTSLVGLVDCLFPINGDYADFGGADSLDGIDYIHPTQVAALSVVIGRTLGMQRSELISLAMAAALMNVGYLSLRRSLLDQPRRLLEGEWEDHVHTHPDRGIALLAQSGLSEDSLRAIAQHHERWDGSGYPGRARGEGISRFARILAVADSFVSLRSIRPYRPPVDATSALEEIAGERGKLFDPDVIDAFEDVIARFSGIVRPARAAAAGATIGTASTGEHAEAQRDGSDSSDGAAAASPDVPSDAGAVDESPVPGPRVARATVADETERRAENRRAAAAPRAIRAVAAAPVALSAPPLPVVAEAPAAPTRLRRGRGRRARHGSTLFSAERYVEASLRGRWSSDSLRR